MPEPTGRQSHIDTALTNVSIGYTNARYIWREVFPIVPVKKQTDKFFTFGKAAFFRDETAVRAPGARAKLAEYTIATDNYVCLEKALAKLVTDEDIDNADAPLQPMITATKFVTDQIDKAVEKDVTDLVFSTGWSSSATPGILWDNLGSDPLGDIETGMNAVAKLIGTDPATLGRNAGKAA